MLKAGPTALWSLLGWVSLILGVIGLLLPIVPTTPFVILAAFAFGKSHPEMRRRLEENRYFGKAIRDWEARGAIRRRHKASACVLMSASLVIAFFLGLPAMVLIIQGGVMAGVAAYIVTRPSADR